MNVLLVFGLVGMASANLKAPTDKVIELLEELKGKMESDGNAEQKLYDKFACYCEKTTAEKASSIETAKSSIESLTHLTMELKGKTSQLNAEIKQLETDLANNQAGQRDATAIRGKENDDYT